MLLQGGTQLLSSLGVLQLIFLQNTTSSFSLSLSFSLPSVKLRIRSVHTLKTSSLTHHHPALFPSNPPPNHAYLHHQHLTKCNYPLNLPLPASRLELQDTETAEYGSEGHIFAAREPSASDLDARSPAGPPVEVKDLEELPEQWRRSKVAWLCKTLPSHKPATLIRLLNSQRKWIRQDDATYVIVHFLRIRENDASFRVYKWMIQQHWFRFDFSLATKLADYLGKERKYSKCRELFDDIVNQGLVPAETTFHILVISYIEASAHGCLEEACMIYNRMIQVGGYQPTVSLNNALFRALVSKPGGVSKYYLKQAEFIYHNLRSGKLEIQGDIYAGLIWLHSYQDNIDKTRVRELREEMQHRGLDESQDVLVSILRISSKEGDAEEAERTWKKLLDSGFGLPSQAFVYRMELFSKLAEPLKSLGIFRGMQEHGVPNSVVAYHKIIEVMSKAQETEIAEALMDEFSKSGLKPLLPAFVDLMNMYLDLNMHDKVESTFVRCATECRPNQTAYNIYLESLVGTNNLGKVEEVFDQMQASGMLAANDKTCNIILEAYLVTGQHDKAEQIYDMMCRNKYEVNSSLIEMLDEVLRSRKKVKRIVVSLKLDQEQREILIGLLLGGAKMELLEQRSHVVHFEFRENSFVHNILRMHIREKFFRWLDSYSRQGDGSEEVPFRLSTVPHSSFGIYADQFWPKGRPMVPKLIYRWLSPCVLAYWYMYGGHKTLTGDILLKIKGCTLEGIERIVKTLKMKSVDCKIMRKGRISWIGCQGSNSIWFWKLVEPYILDDLKEILNPEFRSCTYGELEDKPRI